MRSSARLTYGRVNDFLTGKSQKQIPKTVQDDVRHLHDVFRAFAKNRRKRGAIELDIPQTRINVDEHGAVTSISAVPRNDAHRLIEECMIAAKVKDRPDSVAISMALLRSMSHAEYTPKNIGHFGLALDAYAHFTSPIRRYPDLLVHRAIRHILRGGKAGNYGYDGGAMERLGGVCSEYERRAEDATREVEAWLKCQYMEDKLGEQYEGIITGVTNFGVFVQIPELQIDGLVHVTSLQNDYYRYETGSQSLIGDRSGTQYRLGDRLRIVVSRVDLESKRIDFQLATETKSKKRKR
jgi:ribonuclease R